jgi:arginase
VELVVAEDTLGEQTLSLASELPERPLVLGGCCCAHVGAVEGLASRYERLALVWLDAHGDLNTPETSPTGNVHGMPVAAALGLGRPWFDSPGWPLPMIDPAHTSLIGIRSLDAGEREYLGSSDVRVITMAEIDRIGMERAVQVALDRGIH